jgi:hypothetical protein
MGRVQIRKELDLMRKVLDGRAGHDGRDDPSVQ